MSLAFLRFYNALRRYFLMTEEIAEAAQTTATAPPDAIASTRLARSLLGAAESLDDIPERQLGTLALFQQAASFASQALVLRRQLIQTESSATNCLHLLLEQPDIRASFQGFSPEVHKKVTSLIQSGLSTEHADLSSGELRVLRHGLSEVTRTLVRHAEDEVLIVRQKRAQRVRRWIGAMAVLIFVTVGLFQVDFDRDTGKNIALGAKVTASSTWRPDLYPLSGLVDGDTTQLGCHTETQNRPWVEIDLGAKRTVHRVVVTNRLDGLTERAVPLAIEVSLDGKTYEPFANQAAQFTNWTAVAPSKKARFVRLSVQNETVLHLNEVAIY